ncbi:MAG: ABC transporter substrate-binding protein [Lachnospiraceae bacterium]|nr:ABC transporter substrate-binding protein [Lachnospiraceae bacterium]
MMMKVRKKRQKVILNIAVLIIVIAAGAIAVSQITEKKSVGESNEITVYLDRSNQVYVRMMVAMYDNLSQIAQYSGEEDQYPQISWNLVDKSNLSAEDYREELLQELEAGSGPDLVFLDAYSCESPEALMEEGYFEDLDSWMDSGKCVYQKEHFIEGTLEAGQMDGKQYLIPVSVNIPVFCTTQEQLERAGVSEENLESTEAIFAAAAQYQSRTGNFPFDSDGFLEDLELYIGDRAEWSEALKSCVGQLSFTKNDSLGEDGELLTMEIENQKQADRIADIKKRTDAFLEGDVLFLTEGLEDYRDVILQLTMLPEEESLLFVPLLRADGRAQAVIHQAIAVNRNTADRTKALAAMNAFSQEEFSLSCCENLPASTHRGVNWTELIFGSDVELCWNPETDWEPRHLSSSDSWQYIKMTQNLVETACYPAYGIPQNSRTESARGKMMTVMVPDTGFGKEGIFYRWLAAAAEEFEAKTGICVELILCEEQYMVFSKLLLADQAADITVYYEYMDFYTESDEFEGHVLDFEELFEKSPLAELKWKPGVLENGMQSQIRNVPYLSEQGRIDGFVISAQTEFSKEALEFITVCMERKEYGELLELYGLESVLES